MAADSMGRPPRPAVFPENVKALLESARELEIQSGAPKPILQGRHLLEIGIPSGNQMGRMLQAAFEAQLEGNFFDVPQGLRWLGEQKEIELSKEVREKLRQK
jgi:tRNA nucleotidyltransferase (CCA-adding enzyme)